MQSISETFQLTDSSISAISYYVDSGGEAIIIDPTRDYRLYIKFLQSRQAKLKYIFLTHIPSDYITGAYDLSLSTGAHLIVVPNTDINIKEINITFASNNEEFKFGECIIKAIHTPGHTIESTTYLLVDEDGDAHALFTGDTVLVSSICAPDLALLRNNTMRELAIMHFESIKKIKENHNCVIVYPGHCDGSICVKDCGVNLQSKIIEEKVFYKSSRGTYNRY